MKLRKCIWIISLSFGLYSCEKSDLVSEPNHEPEKGAENITIEDKDPTDYYYREYVTPNKEKYNVLGYGYDATGEYLSPLSVRKQVLDIESYAIDYQERLVTGNALTRYYQFYHGGSAFDYLKDITESSKITSSITRTDNTVMQNPDLYFSGNILNNKYLQSEYSHSDKYSFASVDVINSGKYIRINDEVSRLSKFLSKNFTKDLAKYTADEIVNIYGTHVLTNFTIGGRLKATYRSAITEKPYFTNKTLTLDAQFNTLLAKIGFYYFASSNKQTDEEFNQGIQNKDLYIQLYQENSIMLLKYNLENGMPPAQDIKSWYEEMDTERTWLTEIEWKDNYPIYDFISDPAKKQEVKIAVEEHVRKSQL